jgi:putative membrane protein
MFKKFIIADAVILAGVLMFAGAQAPTQTQTAGTSADRKFATEAASGGMSEVKLGELAKEKGNAQAVKSFGERMITDHSKANDQLKQIAQQSNIQLPEQPDRADQAMYERLSKLSGADFDRAYARAMVKDHEKDIAAFQKEAESGADPQIRQFAAQTLPTLQSHLQEAKQMEQAVSASASSR